MHLSGQWFVAQAVSSIRRGIGTRLAFEVVRYAKRHAPAPAAKRGSAPVAAAQGLTVTVHPGRGLAIEDAVGCTAHVLAGRAWITVDGAPKDNIVDAGATAPLGRGLRLNVGPFADLATVVITAPAHLQHVVFALGRRDGIRVLDVTRTDTAKRLLIRAAAAMSFWFKRMGTSARSQLRPYY